MAEKNPRKRRLSLTKAQRRAGAGAELLALCQSITEDGRISKDEILELRTWLKANKDSDLPAIEFFLTSTVERIVADRRVTKEERKELYKAIETVLPPDVRKDAVGKRRAVETVQQEHRRAQREGKRQRDREERDRKRPLRSVNFMVAGVHYEGRPQIIRRYVRPDDDVFLVRDRANQYKPECH